MNTAVFLFSNGEEIGIDHKSEFYSKHFDRVLFVQFSETCFLKIESLNETSSLIQVPKPIALPSLVEASELEQIEYGKSILYLLIINDILQINDFHYVIYQSPSWAYFVRHFKEYYQCKICFILGWGSYVSSNGEILDSFKAPLKEAIKYATTLAKPESVTIDFTKDDGVVSPDITTIDSKFNYLQRKNIYDEGSFKDFFIDKKGIESAAVKVVYFSALESDLTDVYYFIDSIELLSDLHHQTILSGALDYKSILTRYPFVNRNCKIVQVDNYETGVKLFKWADIVVIFSQGNSISDFLKSLIPACKKIITNKKLLEEIQSIAGPSTVVVSMDTDTGALETAISEMQTLPVVNEREIEHFDLHDSIFTQLFGNQISRQ